ncbi:MAG: family 16 glycoside hydrolase, partial [Verrucomicrobiota bacterium]
IAGIVKGPNVDPKTGTEFRGGKGNLYEGGLKIPFLVQWPGQVPAGHVSDHLFAQYDILATLADLTGCTPPDNDGISILPEILGKSGEQKSHEMLYWEYSKQTAVRYLNWKAIRPSSDKEWELYNLTNDVSETTSLAAEHGDVLAKMIAFAEASHTPVVTGTYSDPERKRHEADRKAKWGTSRENPAHSIKAEFRIKDPNLVPWADLSLVRFSSENRANDRQAAYAVDGKPTTLWHSRFSDGVVPPPHELVVDLGEERLLTGIQYLARQDGGWNGAFGNTSVFVSGDAETWPESPATSVKFDKIRTPQSAIFPSPVSGRYVLVRAESAVGNGRVFASAADIGFLQAENRAHRSKWLGGEAWSMASAVRPSTTEKKKWTSVTPDPAGAIFYNGPDTEKGKDLRSREEYGDVYAKVEFTLPLNGNSGIYFQERYELQIFDSFGRADTDLKAGDGGGIYEHWNDDAPKGKQGYGGTPPPSNASLAPGEWQSYEILFRAPRFNEAGEKTENARFVSVLYNGTPIHQNVEVTEATRGGKGGPEVAKAPLRIQGDHGPVAYRTLVFEPVNLP